MNADQLARDAARTFAAEPARRVLDHLRTITRHRVLGPEASAELLRHVEGQRALVQHLESLIERGRQPVPDATPQGDSHDDR